MQGTTKSELGGLFAADLAMTTAAGIYQSFGLHTGGTTSPGRQQDQPSTSEVQHMLGTSAILHLLNVPVTVSRQVSHSSQAEPRTPRPGLKKYGTKRRAEKTIVYIGVVFIKIGEIDTIKEQYSADVCINSRWREPLLDHATKEELKKADLKSFWSPQIYIENELSAAKETNWQEASLNELGEAYIEERRRLRGVFLENLELQTFPFDVQDLSITVVSERPESEVELVADKEHASAVNTETFVDAQEWKLYRQVDLINKIAKVEFANRANKHSALQVTIRAARRPAFFYSNVILIMLFISSLCFATWAVDPLLPHFRLSLVLTLLLTSIAFKMALNQSLPKVSYLTFMDKYVLLSIGFLILVCIWHSIVVSACSEQGRDSFCTNRREGFALLAYFLVYIIGHAIFVTHVYFKAWKRRQEVEKYELQFLVSITVP